MSITGNLNIGEAGSGSAIVQLGSVLKSKAIEIGGALGASGSLMFSAGTSVTTGEITIGAGGTGTLKVTSGGLLTTNGDASIGSVALGAIVSASLDTGGEWQLRRKTGTMSGCTDPERVRRRTRYFVRPTPAGRERVPCPARTTALRLTAYRCAENGGSSGRPSWRSPVSCESVKLKSAPSRHDIRCGGSLAAPRRCRCWRPGRPRRSLWRSACLVWRRT